MATSGYDLDVFVGTAGWRIAAEHARLIPPYGATQLARYALRLRAAEINSSFHRSHRESTWRRWEATVPRRFRFAVKAPKQVTHEERLRGDGARLEQFLAEVDLLGEKLGPLLVQLPPSLAFEREVAEAFFAQLRNRAVVCEPRHPSWFEDEVDAFLAEREIARVAADPAPVPEAADPGGWPGLRYYRLHGSPRTYWSSYGDEFLDALAQRLAAETAPTWCIFDNTAGGAGLGNAVSLVERLAA